MCMEAGRRRLSSHVRARTAAGEVAISPLLCCCIAMAIYSARRRLWPRFDCEGRLYLVPRRSTSAIDRTIRTSAIGLHEMINCSIVSRLLTCMLMLWPPIGYRVVIFYAQYDFWPTLGQRRAASSEHLSMDKTW